MIVLIDGVRYVPEQPERFELQKNPVPAVVGVNSESTVIDSAINSISESSWYLGQAASVWSIKFARGRSDAAFGDLVGLSPVQVSQRRHVWEKFGDVYQNYVHLRWGHFFAALEWDDANATECLTWANDLQAGVAEMRAWRRAQRGDGE